MKELIQKQYFIHNELIDFKNALLIENERLGIYIPKELFKGYYIYNNKINLIGINENEFKIINIINENENENENKNENEIEFI